MRDGKSLVMHKVTMHAGTMSKLLNGIVFVGAKIHSLKLEYYIPVQTHKPYNNLQFYHVSHNFIYPFQIFTFSFTVNVHIA